MPRFENLDPTHRPPGPREVLRWGIWEPLVGKRKRTPPGRPAPRVEPDLDLVRSEGGPPRLTWLGHAGFLVSVGGRHFLIDPLYARRVGVAYRRYGEPGVRLEDLPPIDAVLVSHNHYDHLDAVAMRALPATVPAVVPRGLGRWFERWNRRPVTELGWWRSTRFGDAVVTLVPARHWSRRRPWDTNRSHWGGFVVGGGGTTLYHAGDTAWFDGFAEIGRRFPGLAAAMLPVGAYEPGWFMERNHLNPEQAGRAFLASRAARFVPMHWGAVRLTDEGLSEPAERVRSWWRRDGPRDGRRPEVIAVGETLVLDDGE